jgi:hypothetical protein
LREPIYCLSFLIFFNSLLSDSLSLKAGIALRYKTAFMKSLKLFFSLFLLFSVSAHSQNTSLKGYKRGKILLSNGTILSGYIKDNTANDASVSFVSDSAEKKVKYSGLEIISAEIEDTKFLCLKGDFFKVLFSGELNLLQKASNVSSKPQYNGTEAIFLNGTEGKPGDYFVYGGEKNQLLWVNKKNKEAILFLFASDTGSLEVAKQNASDKEVIKNAVALYNSHTSGK